MKSFGKKLFFGAMLTALTLGSTAATAQNTHSTNQSSAQRRVGSNSVRTLDLRFNNFKSYLDDILSRARFSNAAEINNLRTDVDDLEQSISDFKEDVRTGRASAVSVEEMLGISADINDFLQRSQFDANVTRSWANVRSSLDALAYEYNVRWDWNNRLPRPSDADGGGGFDPNLPRDNPMPSNNYPTRPNLRGGLNGTYRLDTRRSDNARNVAENAVRSLPFVERERISRDLEARLDAPENLAIEVRDGNLVAMSSNRAAQVELEANGRERVETADNGSQVRVRADLRNSILTVSAYGDTTSNYSVIFEPLTNNQLRVTRRLRTPELSADVVLTSIYEKTDETARLDIYENGYPTNGSFPGSTSNNYPSRPSTRGFIIPDGAQVVAILDKTISSKTANNNDRFTMTVQTPNEYRGAVIEGYISGVERSTQISGSSKLTFNFETIRLRNGSTYDFSGFVTGYRTKNGELVSVSDTEGTIKGDSKTKQTVTRGAVGAGIGALIGAIAGGGKGAAIGAAIGAGAGAGSVVLQGRDDVEIQSGADVTIRASAPRSR